MSKKLRLLLIIAVPLLLLGAYNAYDRLRLSYHDVARHGEDISVYVAFGELSTNRRFIIYDNKSGKILSASKCAHGSGGGSTAFKPVFSNSPGSNCSSLGEYRLTEVSKLYNCGIRCIRLQGLSASNSNAAARGITIHEAPFLGDGISVGIPIPALPVISQGCFGISTEAFELLSDKLKSGATIYLYATDSNLP
ncbi:MAG: hypothetical protein HDS64_06175 [Bacteroidales bacterium]|nr:hypothetical protein [Bacteroidales bacterium]MBD5281556.1 hypothetical protein [Bacteroides sp.]MBD5294509.1 hypothetical protein [Bacteroides sp.]MBD5342940.1 hypothetical protein [Bacteroides sp.]MBD5360067.1 hypothetical protein [Bacteroides sp.]